MLRGSVLRVARAGAWASKTSPVAWAALLACSAATASALEAGVPVLRVVEIVFGAAFVGAAALFALVVLGRLAAGVDAALVWAARKGRKPAMGLRVVEEACKFSPDLSEGTVVMESSRGASPEAIAELQETGARKAAVAYAAQRGMPGPTVNMKTSGTYPVSPAGVPFDRMVDAEGKPIPLSDARMKVASYRLDVPLRGNRF